MEEIQGVGRATRKAYSNMSTELPGSHNEEVHHLWKSNERIAREVD